MKNVKLLMTFLVSVALLIGCGQKAEIQPEETIESPEATESVPEETVPETEASESAPEETVPETEASESTSTEVELILVAVWTEIDVNQAGKVAAAEFIDYYTVKAQEGEKLSPEEAEQKFQTLDRDGNGELTKEEATGEK
jgi:hypothetical protein